MILLIILLMDWWTFCLNKFIFVLLVRFIMPEPSTCLAVQGAWRCFFGGNFSLAKYFWGKILWRNDHLRYMNDFLLSGRKYLKLCCFFGFWNVSWELALASWGLSHWGQEGSFQKQFVFLSYLPMGFPRRLQNWKKLKSEAELWTAAFKAGDQRTQTPHEDRVELSLGGLPSDPQGGARH